MAVLHLEGVPDELVREIEQLAGREQQTPAATAISLLQQAVRHESARQRGGVGEILARIRQNPIRPDPNGPSVVEMLREDRER
ncbi:MAG TPA: hypothetical protein VKA46_23295 [Gemmataceae bacterium]|nr:hypothetical protein [Gemmataceae bacterium]